ncbi:secretogranin-1 [Tiliqua scincoides]|uniref:secretogranin-1 n=1 Tax=Tiliqua scincoides TaxID=71010 RepID=UPI003462E13C
MVTRCIVEVLLNGLSKPNAPPIDPMCRELLKKSNQRKQGEKNINTDIDLGTRQLSEELEKTAGRTVKEEQDLNEEEFKRQTGGGQNWNPEEGKHEENGDQQVLSQGNPYSNDEAHKKEKKNDDEKRNEEKDNSKRITHGEEGSIEKKRGEEVEHELLDKKSFSTTGREAESDYKRSGSQRHSEESAHSQEKGNQASKEEEDGEEEEEESSEKYHHSLHREYEDSFEREEAEAEKRGHKPRHYHSKPRLGNSSEYKRHHNEEKVDSPEESSEEESSFWNKRSHYPKHHHYEPGHHYEKRNSDEMQNSEEMEGRSRSKEYQDRWHYTREDDEEEDMRHHSMESEEKLPHPEKKRPHVESQKEMRHHYEERKPHSKTSEEDLGRQHSNGRRDEKMQQHDKKRQRLQWEETPKPQSVEMGEDLYSPEEGFGKEKKYYPDAVSEEEPDKRHHSEGDKHGSNKRTLLVEEGYPRSHYLVENVKRAATSIIPYYQQLRWKNRHTGKKDDVGDPFLESDEEPRSHLNERDFFPEYNDYDYWEKKQLMDSLNPKRNEHSLDQKHKFDMKRQYNRMDELAHLLNYRKKSAEFPELYDSKEDVKRGHMIRRGEGKLSQRPLTQQEEKELENLAAMDLELQKIAEKFSSNQRG